MRPAPLALLLLMGCTYGPEEVRVTVEQVVGVPDSYAALVVVRYDRYRPPTGLAAFPDGGRARMIERRATLYRVDAVAGSVRELDRRSAEDDVWESYGVRVRALEGDSVAYLGSTGCPRGGECHGDLLRTLLLRVSLVTGAARPVEEVPPGAALPGVVLARRPGERRYARWSTSRGVVSVRLEEGGSYRPLLAVREDGSLAPIEP